MLLNVMGLFVALLTLLSLGYTVYLYMAGINLILPFFCFILWAASFKAYDMYSKLQREEAREKDEPDLVEDLEKDSLKTIVRSLTQRVDELSVRSDVDGLTGLYNKSCFLNRMSRFVATCRNSGENLTLIMFDIDNFKVLNDTYGHAFGDRVIQSLGEMIKDVGRRHREGNVFRYGGEEMAVVLLDRNQQDALNVANALCESARQLSFSEQPSVRITLSLGMIMVRFGMVPNPEAIEVDTIVKLADKQLYQAKRSGKNRLCFDVL